MIDGMVVREVKSNLQVMVDKEVATNSRKLRTLNFGFKA
jgi:hypothetical protein